MKKINIEVADNNLETVLLILQNLKDGLILNIETIKNANSKNKCNFHLI